jgi:ubiquinone/menaquinone biosynthesis C-methylase UbiE
VTPEIVLTGFLIFSIEILIGNAFKLFVLRIIMKQKEAWNKIAEPWKKYRQKPIKEVVDFLKKKKGRILDLGCGSGRNFVKISGTIYGIDFSKKMLEMAKETAKRKKIKAILKESEAHKLPFKNNFFDAAIFIAVLQCIETPKKREKSLKELFRVLKPGADAIIRVWNKDQKRFKNKKKEILVSWEDRGKRYYYLYDKKELEDLLKTTGFEVIKAIKPNENLLFIVRKPT